MRTPLAIAAVLFLLYSAFVAYGPRPVESRFQSGDELNRHVIGRFSHDADRAAVVFVGSSMTARLADALTSPCAFNLALAGDSAATGLDVLMLARARPRLVFVEINVPERANNARLASEASRLLPRLVPTLAPENMPVNLLFSFLVQHRPARVDRGVSDTVLATALGVERTAYAKEIDPTLLAHNLEFIKSRVAKLEEAGARMIFFELPIHPSLEATARAAQIRKAFAVAFPHHRILSSADLAHGTIVQTIDGVHLAPAEVNVIAESLRHVDDQACPAKTPAEAAGTLTGVTAVDGHA